MEENLLSVYIVLLNENKQKKQKKTTTPFVVTGYYTKIWLDPFLLTKHLNLTSVYKPGTEWMDPHCFASALQGVN